MFQWTWEVCRGLITISKSTYSSFTYWQCEWVACEEEGQMCIEIPHVHEREEEQSPSDLSSLFATDAVQNHVGYSLDHKGHFLQKKIQALEMPYDKI